MIKVIELLHKCQNRIPLIIRYLQENKKKVVLYGAGYCGYETLMLMKKNHISVSVICDDNRAGEYLDTIKITKIEQLKPDDNLVIFITSGFNQKMKEKLISLNYLKYYIEVDFGRYDSGKENWEYFEKNKSKINKVYNLLTDDKSRKIFINLINYKISRKLDFLKNMEDENQYFPKEGELDLSNVENSVFLDLGAFDGDTIRSFLKYTHGKYSKIIAVEASKKNYDKLLDNMIDVKNIECYNVGIYKEKAKLSFVISDAKNTFASENGKDTVEVDSVDHIIKDQPVSFIKMDIEGSEYDAILGAKNTLKKNTPILAISVYHKIEDLFRIPLLIEKTHPKYDYYLRHYSPTAIETILYAVPKKGIKNEK
ncbi:FkbM family methyltransferase [Pectinatus frisingensis]|uniref:FkbM family methyltransferase n=1 Tax=Pectinatus frisingensis TaxID=865 RepID=UPI001E370DC3|nr:FkbM family methyltransferase [Pectinatus frisingensis]